jgi:autotransporter-associated beta strand protein
VGGAELYISGPGSIAASSGVSNNGVFDISRAWSAVSIQALTGSGQVRLGGQNLIVTNAAGTYSGTISDAGAYPGTGGRLTLTGGTLVLAGANTYSGGTTVSGGTLQLAAGASLFSGGALTIDGGTFDLNGNTQTVGPLAGNGGTLALGTGTLTAGGASSTFFGGNITGTGGALVKVGAGTLILGGTSSYTGGTTVSAGVLLGTTASLQGNIVNNASVAFSQIGSGAYAGDMSGTGSVTIGSGLVSLIGTNSYAGGTTVAAGATLGVNTDSGMGGAAGGLTLNGGTLQALGSFTSTRPVTMGPGGGFFDTNGNNITLGTAVSGSGGLTKNGAGVLTLGGSNSYAGETVVNAGTLRMGAGASLPPAASLMINGGIFDLNGNSVAVSSLSGSSGSIALGTGNLTVDGAGNSTFGATITGAGGLTKLGAGTLTLAGANTYTGPTNVAGGRLSVNGSLTSDVTVGSGGNLGGSGIITGTVVNNGTLAPGNSIGTLTVVGAYTQAAGSSYQVESNNAGQADRINVTGAPGRATINGGTVSVVAAPGIYAPSTTYVIVNASGGVTGAYTGVSSNFVFLQASLGYDANNVYLTLSPGGFAQGAATPNQASVGGALDRGVAGASGDFATVVGTLATASLAQGQAAMDQLSGQNYAGFGTANVASGLMFMNVLGQQMSLARGGSASTTGSRMALAMACDVACDGDAPGGSPWSVWGSALGATGSIAGNGNSSTLTYNAGGFAAGIDYRIEPRLLVGFGVGFASGNQWLGGFSGRGLSNSYQASVYASFTQGAFYVDALAGYAYNDNQMTRQITIAGLASRTAFGQTGANQLMGQVEAGYRIGLYERAQASITPFARFQAMGINQATFSENGANSLNLNVTQQTTSSVRTVLGAEMAVALDLGWRDKLALQMRLGWAHEYADVARPVTASLAGAPSANFTIYGAAPQRNSAALGLGANTSIAAGTSLYLRYDGEFSTGNDSHSLSAGLRMTW